MPTGSATATLNAASSGLSGADEVVAIAKLSTTTVQGSVSFTVTGSVPTVGLTISAATIKASTGAATLRAVIRNAAGEVVPNVLVSFRAAAGRVALGAPSAMTDGFGAATTSVATADPTVTAADTITASATVNGASVQSSVVVQVLADKPSIALSSISSSAVTASAPARISLILRDAAANPVATGTVVTAASNFGLSAFDATTAVTDAVGAPVLW